MMLSVKTESGLSGPRISNPSLLGWLYFNFELLLGLGLSGFIAFLGIIKSSLPKPPRDLSGDVVLVTGATSTLGCSLAEKFAWAGCSVILVDGPGSRVEELANRLHAKYSDIELVGSRHRKDELVQPSALAYTCDVWDPKEVRALARRIRMDVGGVDILVTCAYSPEPDPFDTVNRTLMSHYWTVLSFLPSMLHRKRAHVIGITPTKSTMDAFMGSKAAVAGLMDSLAHEFNGHNNRLTFMTIAPNAEPSLINQSEQEIANEVVQSVRRDQSCLSMNWSSKLLYCFSCRLYEGITTIMKWFDT